MRESMKDGVEVLPAGDVLATMNELADITKRLEALDGVNYHISGSGNLLASGQLLILTPKDDAKYETEMWYKINDAWLNASGRGLRLTKERPLVVDSLRVKFDGRPNPPIELASKTGDGDDEHRLVVNFEQYIELFDKEIINKRDLGI